MKKRPGNILIQKKEISFGLKLPEDSLMVSLLLLGSILK